MISGCVTPGSYKQPETSQIFSCCWAGNIVIRVSHVKGGEMAARNVLNVLNHFKYFWFLPVLDEEKQGPDCFTYKNGQD